MVADIETVKSQLSLIRGYLKDLKALSQIELADFKINKERQLAVMHALQLAIEGCLNIGAHIISADELGAPKDYADIFDLLNKAKIINTDFAEKMKKMARFRHRLVHLYWDIDLEQLYNILKNNLADFDEYLKFISNYLIAYQ